MQGKPGEDGAFGPPGAQVYMYKRINVFTWDISSNVYSEYVHLVSSWPYASIETW